LIRRHLASSVAILGLAACLAVVPAAAGYGKTAEATVSPAVLAATPVPVPIPGGTKVPGGPLIHGFVPGPKGKVFPFSKLPLGGLNQEPATLTNFSGTTALAFMTGTARDRSGKTFNVEADLRVFRGTYVASDGSRRQGVFGFI
jgi:hypothetical protein